MSTHYATLVIVKVDTSGKVEICNAGHNPPILLRSNSGTRLEATGLPLGMFCDGGYSVKEIQLEKGDSILFYTDGVTETTDEAGVEYGEERLINLVTESFGRSPEVLVNSCLDDVSTYRAGEKKTDDLTILGLQRT
jgi:sigma-B regulation protein RsbU (phosphoserine phosphatase)